MVDGGTEANHAAVREKVWQNEGFDPRWHFFDKHLRKESWVLFCSLREWGEEQVSSGHMELTVK